MPSMPPKETRVENRESARAADVRKGHQAERVSSIEKAGGPTGVRFPVHDHHEHCDVHGPGGSKGTKY
jgi:hypothetical protein